MNTTGIKLVFKELDEKKISYFDRLKLKLEYLTNTKYPQCLSQFEPVFDETVNFQNVVSHDESHCECGMTIEWVHYVKHTKTDQYYIVGSVCIEKFIDDDQHDGPFKTKGKAVLNQDKKCKMCDKRWTHNKCFYKGYCTDCRDEIKNFTLPFGKYSGMHLKSVSDKKYLKWLTDQTWVRKRTQKIILNSLSFF